MYVSFYVIDSIYKNIDIFASNKIRYNGASNGFISEYEIENLAQYTHVDIIRCW